MEQQFPTPQDFLDKSKTYFEPAIIEDFDTELTFRISPGQLKRMLTEILGK